MKRDSRLKALSRDHHKVLVLAQAARKAVTSEDPDAVPAAWERVDREFREKLSPHFEIEERVLLPLLEAFGELPLARQTRREHAAIREAVAPGAHRNNVTLDRLAELLENHVRFEEVTLFTVAQERLSDEALEEVADAAHPGRRAAGVDAAAGDEPDDDDPDDDDPESDDAGR